MMAKEVSALLAKQAEAVAKYLLPEGKRRGNEYYVGSLNGEEGSSLKICLNGEKAGIWCDFATGQKGDLINLFALANNRNLNLSEAIIEAKMWLGVDKINFEPQQPRPTYKPTNKNLSNIASHSPAFDYLTNIRKISPTTIAAFNISEEKGNIVFPYYKENELKQIKYLSLKRENGKKKMWAEAHCEPCLFGWQTIPKDSRIIALTEGELDCMTLYQYGIPALSLPFGGGSGEKHKWIDNDFDFLCIYDEVYLCLDNDSEGQIAIKDLVDRLGRYRCRIVTLPFKDANECLQNEVTKEQIKSCFDSAKSLDPQELKSANFYVEEVINEFYPKNSQPDGISPPWKKANDKIFFRHDELSIWCGINGHGKSQLLGQIILHSIKEGAGVCIASLELKPKRLLMRMTKQASALAQPTRDYIYAIHNWFTDKLWVFDLIGTAKTNRILDVFKYARQRYGATVFVIDSLMKCDIAEDDYRAQKEFIDALCDFKNEFNAHVHLVVHPRKGANEFLPPSKLDAKGSGAITDLADNCFTVWRNKPKQEEIQKQKLKGLEPPINILEQPDCLWICDKQRNGEWEGRINLWFDPISLQFLEHPNQKPIRYVDFENRQQS